MSFYCISLHAKPFMLQHELAMRLQHELAMTLQLLATQNIGSRPFTTALHFRRYKKKTSDNRSA